MSIQLYEHRCTYLWGIKPSEVVDRFNQLLAGQGASVYIADDFNDFFAEAETCLLAGATQNDRDLINLWGRVWVEHQRTHGYPTITPWHDEPTWYVEHPDTAGMVRCGWNGKRFVTKGEAHEEAKARRIAAANALPEKAAFELTGAEYAALSENPEA